MKIVEIIVLMGTQCISPIQHAPMVTEVSKVPCAVVIEKDSITNIVEVSPRTAVNHPTVSEAMVRLAGQTAGTAIAAAPAGQPFRIEPAAAARRAASASSLPQQPPYAAKPLQEPLALPPELQTQETDAAPQPNTAIANLAVEPPESAQPEEAQAEPEPEPPKPATKARAVKKKKTSGTRTAKLADRCSGKAVAKWYTNKDGHRKYRCVAGGKPAKSAAKAPKPLY